MRWGIVRTIALKELVESLRDRRTLFMMVVVPVLLYPVLILTVTQVASVQQGKLEAKRSRVAIEGAARAPTLADQLGGAEHLSVERVGTGAEVGRDAYDVVVTVGAGSAVTDPLTTPVSLAYDSVEDSSRLGLSRVQKQLEAWSRAEVDRRLAEASLPRALASPLEVEVDDHADQEARGGWVIASILPLLVVMTVLLGAYYPAIDLTAGEKERGSIQTLLTAPIETLEVVAGKYLAVTAIAVISGVVNVVSMAAVLAYSAAALPGDVDLTMSPRVAAPILLIVLLAAGLLAAVSITVAVLARDFKDGQNLMTPVIMVCVVPGVVVQMPGFELTPAWALVPVANVMLLMKQVLIRGVEPQSMFLVAVSSLTYTAALLVMASRLFAQERVVVGERGRFLLRARPQVSGGTPGTGQALALYAVLFVLVFYAGGWLQARSAYLGLALTLWGLLGVPTVLTARASRLSLRDTFSWHRPALAHLVAAALLGGSLWVVVGAADAWGVQRFLPVPKELSEAMAAFFPRPSGWWQWMVLLGVASVSPAICEEVVFRGFIFSGLRSQLGAIGVIVVSALLFGAFHMSLHRMFGATTLGLAMGMLVWRSGSLWTSMLFHGLNNGVALVVAHTWGQESATAPAWVVGAAAGVSGLGVTLLWLVGPKPNRAASTTTR